MDKQMVLALKTPLIAALFPRDQISDPRAAMPPDRDLTPAEFQALRDLIKNLK